MESDTNDHSGSGDTTPTAPRIQAAPFGGAEEALAFHPGGEDSTSLGGSDDVQRRDDALAYVPPLTPFASADDERSGLHENRTGIANAGTGDEEDLTGDHPDTSGIHEFDPAPSTAETQQPEVIQFDGIDGPDEDGYYNSDREVVQIVGVKPEGMWVRIVETGELMHLAEGESKQTGGTFYILENDDADVIAEQLRLAAASDENIPNADRPTLVEAAPTATPELTDDEKEKACAMALARALFTEDAEGDYSNYELSADELEKGALAVSEFDDIFEGSTLNEDDRRVAIVKYVTGVESEDSLAEVDAYIELVTEAADLRYAYSEYFDEDEYNDPANWGEGYDQDDDDSPEAMTVFHTIASKAALQGLGYFNARSAKSLLAEIMEYGQNPRQYRRAHPNRTMVDLEDELDGTGYVVAEEKAYTDLQKLAAGSKNLYSLALPEEE